MNTEKNTTFTLIAGPCVVESYALLEEVASELTRICSSLPIRLIFKSSYRKANRSSIHSFTGIGDRTALEYLRMIGEKYRVPTLTDIHSAQEAEIAAEFVDILQIPAFLCRQTDIVLAAAKTQKPVNVKKGQFLSPEEMRFVVEKIRTVSNQEVFLTERGTFFGYHDLVVDFRSLVIMKRFDSNCAVIYDATHSLQQPGISTESGGLRQFLFPLARAAVAVGVDGVFVEVHPNPPRALSDKATQLPLDQAESFIRMVLEFHQFRTAKGYSIQIPEV